ncbi:MAG: polysaccharide biosynthesis/export family protein [Cyanobacteria bacterium P01_F01_bin.150]
MVTVSLMIAPVVQALNNQAMESTTFGMLKVTAQERLEDARQNLIQTQPIQLRPSNNERYPAPSSSGAFGDKLDTSEDNQLLDFDVYRLGPGDSFYVNVEGFPEVNFQATLDLEGNILVPLVGIRSFRGLTLNEAKAMLQTEMVRLFVDPVVDLTLVARRPVRVTLLGEVFQPGFYPLSDPQLASAILSAGGVTRLANLTTVQVRRTVLDQQGNPIEMLEQNFNLFEALQRGQALPNIRLDDGDVIIIPTLTEVEAAEYDRTLVARSNLARPSMTIRVLSYPTRIGNLDLPNGSTFVDAVTALSPSFSEANLRTIGLIRFDPVLGKVTTQELNAKKALMGDASHHVVLEDHDVLVISRSLLGRVTHYLNTFTQPFRDVLGFLLFFDTLSTSAENIFAPSSSAE